MSANTLLGHCHCGAIRVALHTDLTAQTLPLRACQCSFCTRQGARMTSDPSGQLEIQAAPEAIHRYRFGLGITDFLICAACGCFVAAVMQDEDGLTGVVNVRATALPGFEAREPSPMIYDEETPEQRRERRGARWMSVTLVETPASL